MKKAVTLPQYANVKPFSQPEGVVDVQLDKITNRLATPSCPDDYTIAFVTGTEPHDTCDQSGGVQGFFSRIFGGNSVKALPPPTSSENPQPTAGVQSSSGEEAGKKKSLFGKIVGVFKGDSGSQKSSDKNTPAPSKPQ
jgi:penicillin-binding protein 1B